MNTILQQSLEVDKEAKIKRLIKYYNLFYKMQRMSLEVEWDYYMEYVKSENQILEIYRNFFKRGNSDETERVMKSLVGEFTQNEKWSVKGSLMGECWYKDCCVSEHPDNLRCGRSEIEDGDGKMK